MSPFLLLLALQAEKPVATFRTASEGTVGKGLPCTLILDIPEGLHGYQNPPADESEIPIKLSIANKAFKILRVDYPKGVDFKMADADKPSRVYEGRVEIPFVLIPTTAATKTIDFKVDYQLCNDSSCFPPGTLSFKMPVKIVLNPRTAKKP